MTIIYAVLEFENDSHKSAKTERTFKSGNIDSSFTQFQNNKTKTMREKNRFARILALLFRIYVYLEFIEVICSEISRFSLHILFEEIQ